MAPSTELELKIATWEMLLNNLKRERIVQILVTPMKTFEGRTLGQQIEHDPQGAYNYVRKSFDFTSA